MVLHEQGASGCVRGVGETPGPWKSGDVWLFYRSTISQQAAVLLTRVMLVLYRVVHVVGRVVVGRQQ